ncbi:MAG: DUF2191 domain-containing protein [Bacteroidetes bacterium]|nr:DUF2191 domain-containing protein [Bacteroidota bacterium]MCH8233145.1 DUF2191 domain-containing protein [Bacteroidota bacterium]
MKVTAIIPDQLIERVKHVSGGKNITESLLIALDEYLKQKEITYLMDQVKHDPLVFNEDATAYNIRKVNRKR